MSHVNLHREKYYCCLIGLKEKFAYEVKYYNNIIIYMGWKINYKTLNYPIY